MAETFEGKKILKCHCIPIGDLDIHVAQIDCWCHPTEPSPGVVTHNAKDCREARERLNGEACGGWTIVKEFTHADDPANGVDERGRIRMALAQDECLPLDSQQLQTISKLLSGQRVPELKRALAQARNDVNKLNEVLRRAGWGQGEIDSCWTLIEEAEQRAEKWKKCAMELVEAADPFRRMTIIQAGLLIPDEKPVWQWMPHGWPKMGDCKVLVDAIDRAAALKEKEDHAH